MSFTTSTVSANNGCIINCPTIQTNGLTVTNYPQYYTSTNLTSNVFNYTGSLDSGNDVYITIPENYCGMFFLYLYDSTNGSSDCGTADFATGFCVTSTNYGTNLSSTLLLGCSLSMDDNQIIISSYYSDLQYYIFTLLGNVTPS